MSASGSPKRLELLRRIPGEERVRLSLALTHTAFEMTRQGIRDQHPGWGPEQVERELRRRLGYQING